MVSEPTQTSTGAGTHSPNGKVVRRICILGGGTAGLLAALTLQRKGAGLEVEVIRSTEMGVIAVGEGSTWTLPIYLHGYLGIDPAAFHRAVSPTYKLGIRFLWGPRERFHYVFTSQLAVKEPHLPRANGFYCRDDFDFADINSALAAHERAFEKKENGDPLIPVNVAYHMENRRFVEFLEQACLETGVVLSDDRLGGVETDESGVKALRFDSGRIVTADLYIDCSGFRAELIDRALGEEYIPYDSSLFCDRAVVGGWKRSSEPLHAFTTAETMNSGWAWQIEHDEIINRGYVYSSSFVSDEEADAEFRRKNPKVEKTRVVRFRSGRYRRSWVKNVVAIGNAAGFVEPLEATAISVITSSARLLMQTLMDSDYSPSPAIIDLYNKSTGDDWDEIRRFLALHYKFNSRIESPFWTACRSETDLAGAEEIIEHFKNLGPTHRWAHLALQGRENFGWEGYLVWLVGPGVPYESSHRPASAEQAVWTEKLARLRKRALAGLTQEEALPLIRSDAWQWNHDFYRNIANHW